MTAATQPATPAAPNSNEPVRVNHTARNIIITIVVVAIIAVAAFFGYRAVAGANESSAKGSKDNPVKIGVVGATNPEWVKFKQNAEKAGIYVDIVDFQDYTSENPALDSGELDLNEFQHLLYLANYNVSNNKDLQPIGGTAIYPLGVYSNNDYVADAGLNPKDAIYQDDAESEESRPYINVWVARKADVNNETYKKLVSIFQQKDVLDALQENSGGTAVFADKFSAKQLQGFLSDIEKDAKAQK